MVSTPADKKFDELITWLQTEIDNDLAHQIWLAARLTLEYGRPSPALKVVLEKLGAENEDDYL